MHEVWDESKVQLSTEVANLYMENGILMGQIKNVQHTKANMKGHVEQLSSFLNGTVPPAFFDATHLNSIGTQERKEYKYVMETLFKKIAIFSNTPARNSMVNIYLGLIQPAVPTRIFHSQTKAIEWLLSD